jgi:hypothetical protein
MIYDESGTPVDYRFVDVNASFERQTGLHGATGHTVRELVPEHETHWFEIYGRIAKSQTPERFEASAAGLGRIYEAYGFPIMERDGNRVGVLFQDVTDCRHAEEEREMLTHELSHRVKNTLAVVHSLVRQSGARKTRRSRPTAKVFSVGCRHCRRRTTSSCKQTGSLPNWTFSSTRPCRLTARLVRPTSSLGVHQSS